MTDAQGETPREAWLDEAEIIIEPGHHRMKLADVLRHFRPPAEQTLTLDVKLEEVSEVVGRLAELLRDTGGPAEAEGKLAQAFDQIAHVQGQLDHLQKRIDEIRGNVNAMRRVAFIIHEAPQTPVRYATTEVQSAEPTFVTRQQPLPARQERARRTAYVQPGAVSSPVIETPPRR